MRADSFMMLVNGFGLLIDLVYDLEAVLSFFRCVVSIYLRFRNYYCGLLFEKMDVILNLLKNVYDEKCLYSDFISL